MIENLSKPTSFEIKTAIALGTLWGSTPYTIDSIRAHIISISPFAATQQQIEVTTPLGPSLRTLLGDAWTEKAITEAKRNFGVDLSEYHAVEEAPGNIATAIYIKIDGNQHSEAQ